MLVKRAMLAAAARSVLLMDSSKAPRRALHQLCPLDEFDALVVDDGVDQELLPEMREHVEVTVAPPTDHVLVKFTPSLLDVGAQTSGRRWPSTLDRDRPRHPERPRAGRRRRRRDARRGDPPAESRRTAGPDGAARHEQDPGDWTGPSTPRSPRWRRGSTRRGRRCRRGRHVGHRRPRQRRRHPAAPGVMYDDARGAPTSSGSARWARRSGTASATASAPRGRCPPCSRCSRAPRGRGPPPDRRDHRPPRRARRPHRHEHRAQDRLRPARRPLARRRARRARDRPRRAARRRPTRPGPRRRRPDVAAATGLRPGTPVLAGITDGCAAQFGAGAVRPGDWNAVLGTTLVLKGVADRCCTTPPAPSTATVTPGRLVAARRGLEHRRRGPGRARRPGALRRAHRALPPTRPATCPLSTPSGTGERFPFAAPDAAGFWLDGDRPRPLADLAAAAGRAHRVRRAGRRRRLRRAALLRPRRGPRRRHRAGGRSPAAPPATAGGTSTAPTSSASRCIAPTRPNRRRHGDAGPGGGRRRRRRARPRRCGGRDGARGRGGRAAGDPALDERYAAFRAALRRARLDGDTVTELVLVRHGEPVWHADTATPGRSDVALTPRGHEQAAELARWAAGRARRGAHLAPAPGPRDRRPGRGGRRAACRSTRASSRSTSARATGRTRDEMREAFPDALDAFLRAGEPPVPRGRGGRRRRRARRAGPREAAAAHPDGRVLVVAHQTLLRLLLCSLLGLPLDHYRAVFPRWRTPPAPSSASTTTGRRPLSSTSGATHEVADRPRAVTSGDPSAPHGRRTPSSRKAGSPDATCSEHTARPTAKETRRVAFATLIGTSIEWFDFFVYGAAAALVFGSCSSRPRTR